MKFLAFILLLLVVITNFSQSKITNKNKNLPQECSKYQIEVGTNECATFGPLIVESRPKLEIQSADIDLMNQFLNTQVGEQQNEDQNDNNNKKSGYCKVQNPKLPTSNHEQCGSKNDILFLYNIVFDNQFLQQNYDNLQVDYENSIYIFQFGVDHGCGTQIFLNDLEIEHTKKDIWWNGNWQNAISVEISFALLADFDTNLDKNNVLRVFGCDQCCDGKYNIRFKNIKSSDQWRIISEKEPEIDSFYIETRKKGEIFDLNLMTQFSNSPVNEQGYCKVKSPILPINNQKQCGSGRNILFKYMFYLEEPSDFAEYKFYFGVDHGCGTVAYFDDELILSQSQGTWWNGNWQNALILNKVAQYGNHILRIYGCEECCDGNYNFKFYRNEIEQQITKNF